MISYKKLSAKFFIIKSIGVIIFTLLSLYMSSCSTEKNLLPESLFGYKLEKKLYGSEAKEFVDRLHFQQVAPENNEIGFYKSPAGSAAIYLTYYDSKSTAQNEYKKMINKISPSNSVFTDPEIFQLKGKEIFKCFGLNQIHYVFVNNKELFWLSVDEYLGNKFINDYLEFIN